MLHFIHGNELADYPKLRTSMHLDRAAQFKERLGWDIVVDPDGLEVDQYDALDPIYVIWEKEDGSHGGSARFLPTTGRTMVNEQFRYLSDGLAIRSPFIWECTRFCISRGTSPNNTPAIMLGGAMLMRAYNINSFVGVFDAPLLRVYRHIGVTPNVLSSSGHGRSAISLGFWNNNAETLARLQFRSGISFSMVKDWYANSLKTSVLIRLRSRSRVIART